MLNRRRVGLLRCAIVVLIVAVVFGAAVRVASIESLRQKQVSFSKPSGFYDEPFYLELDAGSSRIYYTLDGSTPSKKSTRYTGPILIEDATSNENVYSMIENVSIFYYPELLEKNAITEEQPYQLPQAPVDKATVIRAISVDASGKKSDVAEAVYFVGYGEKRGYEGVKIITVTTDPDNLFDSKDGIYVLGRTFAKTVEDGIITDHESGSANVKANYQKRGRNAERRATVHCFDANRVELFSGEYGIRIQGNRSRKFNPKNLNLFAREEYGGALFDAQALFGIDGTLKSVNLNTGSHDQLTMLRDYLVNDLAEGMDVAVREYEPCALFLNGEYWGLYWLTPKFKKDYLSRKFDVQPDNIVELKVNKVEVGSNQDYELYEEMRNFIVDNDMSQADAYAQACDIIDIESCIDYYALEIYISNTDWPNTNWAMWRCRNFEIGNPYGDGRWRWIVFDLNLAMRERFSTTDTLAYAIEKDAIFASLMQNEQFAAAIEEKLAQLATGVFEPSRIDAYIEDYKAEMADAMSVKYQRFYGENRDVDDFYAACDSIGNFFHKRYDYFAEANGGIDQ